MIAYTPFEKSLENLDEQELQKLIDNEISEGWCIEYKADLPKQTQKLDVPKILKPISAFANTKGGWLFYGVEASNTNIAVSLTGIDLSQYNNLTDQISQIISSNISPQPVFHFKVVLLKNGNSVLIIKVEESPVPPYITSQGIIYQRENNESKPIKDRYIIEKLSEKTNEYYESIDRFCNIDYAESRGQTESSQSYLELYLFPLPHNGFRFTHFFESVFFEKVSDIFFKGVSLDYTDKEEEKTELALNLRFNSIYSSQNSLIVRNISEENVIHKAATTELFSNGNLKVLIPLVEFGLNDIPTHYSNSELIEYLLNKYAPYETKYEHSFHVGDLKEVTERKETDFVNYIRMIDGVELFIYIMILLHMYKAVLKNEGFDFTNRIGYRARITKTWRKFLFFDNEEYLEKIKKYNVPIALKQKIEIPTFVKGKYYTFDINEDYSFSLIINDILTAIGLPDATNLKLASIIEKKIKSYKNSID